MNNTSETRRGRPAKPLPDSNCIMSAVIHFLQLFIIGTLAKRVVCLILIAVDLPHDRIIELTGISDRSIWAIKKALHNGNMDNLFIAKHGGGRTGKAEGLESAIAEEIERNNYHTRQQVADMILEKYGINMSVSAVGKLLKKTASES